MSRARSEFIRIRGLRYHVRRLGAGEAPWLFMLHGWSDAASTFEPMLAPLAQRWRIVAPDWRGFGHSQWAAHTYWFPDYLADLDALIAHYCGEAPLALIGHSMGAQVASLYAGLRPERVHRLVLLDGLFLPDMPLAGAAKRFRHWLDALRRPPTVRRYPSLQALADQVRPRYPQLSAAQARWLAQRWSRPTGDGGVELLADPLHRMDGPLPYQLQHSQAIWREVRAPTLFLDGAKSPFVQATTPEQRRQTLACFADQRQRTIDAAGHMLHIDAPQQTAQHIADFLDS